MKDKIKKFFKKIKHVHEWETDKEEINGGIWRFCRTCGLRQFLKSGTNQFINI